MRMLRKVLVLFMTVLVASVSTVLGQGPLQPAAAPAPTMKTLAQVEPRMPITNLPYTITQPGSYYLVGNLTGVTNAHGITVNCNDVAIDLMGFTLSGAGANSRSGIYQFFDYRNLAVRNGTLVNWLGEGYAAITAYGRNGHFENLTAITNGRGLDLGACAVISRCQAAYHTEFGIVVGAQSLIDHCGADHNQNGIYGDAGAVITDCAASYNSSRGIHAGRGSVISACAASYNLGDGIDAGDGSAIVNCAASYNQGRGINTSGSSGLSIKNCAAGWNKSDGIYAVSGCEVLGNTCRNNGYDVYAGNGAGIRVAGDENRIDSNHLSDNDQGLAVTSSGNAIMRNTAGGNATNYAIVAGNATGALINVSGGGAIAGDAWANIAF
ncbi:MAG: hypothetical protein A2X46_13530 [Lentisphaerae bacterium GWF2_57_35]|nr:MAG: hypothetical protein A2X46_13530 [Lentisphaerae bacterium GWF2_57_35]